MFYCESTLEICADASINNNTKISCSGAVCLNTNESQTIITLDSTNNRGEILAIDLAVRMADRYSRIYPRKYNRIHIYSDSQFAIKGLRDWMITWKNTINNKGEIFNSNNQVVKNHSLFMMIISYCTLNNLIINFYNQKGHVNINSKKSLAEANAQFFSANGFYLKYNDLIRISNGNNYIDKLTKEVLQKYRNEENVYKVRSKTQMVHYIIQNNFKDYIR